MRKAVLGLLAAGLLWPGSLAGQTESDVTTTSQAYPALVEVAEAEIVDGQPKHFYRVRFTGGPQAGQAVDIGDDESVTNTGFKSFSVGDRVLVVRIDHISGTDRYLILDHDRVSSLWWLIGLFVIAIIWFSRWRGVRSLIGLGFSFVVIIGWIVPQISSGSNPIVVTTIGATAILLVSFLVLEGFTRTTIAAGAGTVVTMILTGLLSLWAIDFMNLTGDATEETFFLQGMTDGLIDVRGLLLAGIIIGTLGILDDIAISQVATVAELRRANPKLKPWALYRAALRVGRSHLSAIINTLVLAYAGAALPLLVLFQLGQQDSRTILNGEIIATEIARSIVGTLGLILAVPLTTAAAVWLKVSSDHQYPDHDHPASIG